MNHKDWLDNEYNLWIEALQSSTVNNFKENAMVKRMLGEVDPVLFEKEVYSPSLQQYELLKKIDAIGFTNPPSTLSGSCLRMIYYARQVLEKNPKSIVEIGGGVGEFYAVLRALGYHGDYYIYDIPQVQNFQCKYLREVNSLTGLKTKQDFNKHNFCVSFYALGEFDDEIKNHYITVITNACQHGFIIWNAHSGASNDLSGFRQDVEIKEENPLTSEGNLQITW